MTAAAHLHGGGGAKISARIDALLAKERACKRGKPEGTR